MRTCPTPGTRVRYTREFLRNTGSYTGRTGMARGRLLSEEDMHPFVGKGDPDGLYFIPSAKSSIPGTAYVLWDDAREPRLVHCGNLEKTPGGR